VHDYQCGEEDISVEGLIEAQRRLSVSKNPFERVVGSLCLAGLLKEKLAALPDESVRQLMLDHVWSELDLLGPESVIVEIASERLLNASPVLSKTKRRTSNHEESRDLCPSLNTRPTR
jgi:hypothetical protein